MLAGVKRWMVILESADARTGETSRDVFEITPPPEAGRERTILRQLVHGIHAGAVERSFDGAVAVFDEGPRTITARFTIDGRGDDGDRPGGQGTLFG
jgi:hypothetical protein